MDVPPGLLSQSGWRLVVVRSLLWEPQHRPAQPRQLARDWQRRRAEKARPLPSRYPPPVKRLQSVPRPGSHIATHPGLARSSRPVRLLAPLCALVSGRPPGEHSERLAPPSVGLLTVWYERGRYVAGDRKSTQEGGPPCAASPTRSIAHMLHRANEAGPRSSPPAWDRSTRLTTGPRSSSRRTRDPAWAEPAHRDR